MDIDFLKQKSYKSFEIAQQMNADSVHDIAIVMYALSAEQLMWAIKIVNLTENLSPKLEEVFHELQTMSRKSRMMEDRLVTKELCDQAHLLASVVYAEIDKVLKKEKQNTECVR